MPTSDAFITTLSQQLGAAPQFRDALLDALLALLTDAAPSGEAARTNHLDLLIDIESQHARAEQSGKTRLNAALTTLAARVREELQQNALNLHHAIKSGNQALAAPLAQQIGVDAQTFPVGLAVESNLLELSEQYVRRAQELQFLHANAPDQLAEIKEVIFRKKVENANQLDAIALEALAGTSLSKQYQRVKTICLSLMQQQRVEAENALSSVLSAPNADVEALESWLLKYGLLARQIVKEIRLNPTYRRRLLRLLIASREPLALQALSEFTPPTQAERDIFDTLMTLRFGEEFQQTRATWKTRLNQQLGAARHRKEALAFWQRNLSFLPGLLADKWPSLGFNGEFKQIEEACQKEMAAINAEEFLAAQRGNLEAEQMLTLEQALHARSAAPKIEFDESELHEAAMPEIEIEDAPGSSAEPALIAPPMPPTPMTPMIQPTPPEIEVEEGMMLITEAPIDEPVAALKPQPKKPAITLTPTKRTSAIPPKPVAPFVLVAPVEPERSIWGDVIFPFISKNLVFVLAPTLIFIGLLLLVFTLWDKAAWIRYGLTPFMIVTVSYALARIGVWLKGEDIQSDAPIHTLQGAAIFLAPLSLLFVALLSADPKFPSFTMKVGWGAALSIVLLAAWRHIFLMATKTISAAMSGMHTMTLLLLNALLLLLPLTRAMSSAEYGALNLQAKGLFIGGFYVGFLVLFFSMLHVFRTNLAQAESKGKNPLTFYGVTALGTYLLVWGLTHARLGVLPQPHTYAPLLLLLSLLMAMFEFELLEARKSDERITSLHYFAYALVGFGVLLSIGHDYVRVLSLLLAGAVWAYQAVKLNDDRHYNIALAIFTIGFSSIALIKGFPAPYFPHFALLIVIALYLISANIRHEAVALLALRLVPVYLAFSFVISVIWQWSGQFAALPYGVAFLLFGAFAIYTGAKLDKLLHVHLGAFYLVAALPYLGAINVNGRTLDGNTMAFALSVVAAGWVLLSSYSSNPAIRDSRSTVLWNIGLLAFALLCLRLVLKDSIDFSSNPLLQVQILGGPLFIALLMLLNAYFTRSYLPVYLGLFIAVVIFPEIKNRFDIPMYSGLGSTISGIGFLATVWALRFFDFLGVEPASLDLILRKNPFPAQARNRYLLYANPLMVGAFFLFTRTVFMTYPLNVFRPLMPFSLNTCIAVFLCGTAYHVLSLWFKQSWMSFIGYAAIWFGLIHSCFLHVGAVFEPKFLPLFILSALLYCLAIATAAKWLPDNDDEELLRSPWQSVLEPVIFTLTALGLYACYSVYHAVAHDIAFAYWLPLLVYLIGRMAWQGWREEQKTFIAFAYLLLWQTVVVVVTRGAAIPAALELPETYLSSVVMTLALLGALLVGRRWLDDTKCRLLSPIPYLSFCVILVISLFMTYPLPVFRALMPFSLNTSVVVFLCGAAYLLLTLWLKQSWIAFIGYIAIWFGLMQSCFMQTGIIFQPQFLPLFMLAALLLCLAITAAAGRWLPEQDAALIRSPWQSVLEPVIFAITAVGFYAFYSFDVARATNFAYWLPLLVYLIGRMVWQGWREEQHAFIAFAHLLLWQTVVVVVTRGATIPAALELPETYLSSVVMTLALLGALLVGRRWLDDTKCRLLSPIPYLSFCVILVISLFMTYPLPVFRALMPFSLNTSVVVFLCGAAYLLLALWLKQSWIAFIGYIAIWFGLMQSCFMQTGIIFQPQFLPLFMLAALLLCLAIAAAAGRWLPEQDAALIRSPWQSLLEPVIFVLAAVGLYACYSVYHAVAHDIAFAYWLPLLVYLIGRMVWQGWHEEQKTFIAFAHLLLWQTVVFVVTRGAALPAALEFSEMYLGTAVMTLVLLASFFVTERLLSEPKYRLLSPVLWLSSIFMLLISIPTTALFYMLPRLIEQPALHIAIWGAVTLLLGRFLSFSPLWLWSIFLFYSLIMRLIAGDHLIKTAFHPLPLACLAVAIAGVSQLVKAAPQLSEPAQSLFGKREAGSNAPLIFSFASQVVAYLTISQALANPMYSHAWPTMLGLFVCAIPGLLIADTIGTSRQALFLLPYTIAWGGLMLALPTHFPNNAWLMALETPHLVACGMALGLLTGILLNLLAPTDEIGYVAMKHNTAGGMLLLILYAYFTTLDLNAIGWQRFVTSGAVSLIAAYYFRYFVGDAYKRVTYALFACGLTVGMLCVEFATAKFLFGLALSPSLVFYALLLPPLWFLVKSDINRRAERIYASGRDAATHLCFYLLAFYVAPPLLKLVFLPQYAPTLEHLFLFAPIALLLALMLIRLHSLEAPSFVVHIGVLISLFAAWAGISRLIVEIVGAKPSSLGQTFAFFTTVAVGVAYAVLLTTGKRGVLTRFWRWLGAIDDDLWASAHLTLLPYLLIHTHALFAISVSDFAGQRMLGVLLLLLAGIWIIAGYRSDKPGYYWVALAEIIAALYSCRIQPTYWTEAWIIWSLLALYALLIPLYGLVLKRRHENAVWHLYGWLIALAVFVFYEQITFFGLYSRLGIAPLLLLWILTFFVPVAEAEKEKEDFDALMSGMAYAPAFFFFLQQGPPSLAHLPNTLLATMMICGLMTAYRAANLEWLSVEDVEEWRVAHHFHAYLSRPHSAFAIMIPATAAVAFVHVMTYAFSPTLFARQYVAMFLSQLLLAAYWYDQARTQEKWQPMVLSEAIFFGALLTLRQALPTRLHLDWTAEWDVWAGVMLTAIMYAARLLLRRQHAAIRVPIRYTLFLAPLATIAYGVANNVGYETLSRALLVFSTLFLWQAYSEKDRFIMSYALLGVNAYLMLMLFEREVHSPQAYVTPVCLSILILAQVFRDLTSRATANFARSVALTVMLGSAMSEAIVRHYNSPLQHFILIGLSILAMAAAALLKIQIFAAFGLFGFIVDIIAVMYIVLSKQDTDTLKVILGVGFTLLGGLILTGYILYRKNKERIDEMTEEFKETFMAWD